MRMCMLTCGVSRAKFRLPLSAGDTSGLGLTGWLEPAAPEPTLIALELSIEEPATLMQPIKMRHAVESMAMCSIVRSGIPWIVGCIPEVSGALLWFLMSASRFIYTRAGLFALPPLAVSNRGLDEISKRCVMSCLSISECTSLWAGTKQPPQ